MGRGLVKAVSSRLWRRMPAMKLPGMLSGAMSPSKRFLPSMDSEKLMWSPLPA